MMKILKPLLRGHFHQAMFFVSLGACCLLIAKSNNATQLTSTIIYSLCLLLMFGISALYHRINWSEKPRFFMKKLDHSAIYLMIAGTCTPLALLVLERNSGVKLLITIWMLAVIGVFQSVFFVRLPKIVSAFLYMIAAGMVIPYLRELFSHLGIFNSIMLLLGGIVYVAGAIIYSIKRPALKENIFGYHEAFHALVSMGAVFHFVMIYSVIS